MKRLYNNLEFVLLNSSLGLFGSLLVYTHASMLRSQNSFIQSETVHLKPNKLELVQMPVSLPPPPPPFFFYPF